MYVNKECYGLLWCWRMLSNENSKTDPDDFRFQIPSSFALNSQHGRNILLRSRKIIEFANSVDPDEAAHYEPPH